MDGAAKGRRVEFIDEFRVGGVQKSPPGEFPKATDHPLGFIARYVLGLCVRHLWKLLSLLEVAFTFARLTHCPC